MNANVTTASRLLTTVEIAEILGVTTKTLERWRSLGEGPAYVRLSRAVLRYRHEDLETFLRERRTVATGT